MSCSIINQISREIYNNINIHDFADERYEDEGYPHSNIEDELIDELFDASKPLFWLEVGSMIGNSAIKVAARAKLHGSPVEIICIDPFTGDVNMWEWERSLKDKSEWQFLRLENGEPTIRKRFLANVAKAGATHQILPIQCTSIVGMKLLRRLRDSERINMLPEVIYLDSAHETGETLLELMTAWTLLEPKGILVGDDWSWEAVRNDVQAFSRLVGRPILMRGDHWMLKK